MNISPELMEALADIEHKRWASWQQYVFDKCSVVDGNVVIPGWAVENWKRQINTPYADLSEKEKEADRREVRKYLEVFKENGGI